MNLRQLKQCSQLFQRRYNKPSLKTGCSDIASILVMVILDLFIWKHLVMNLSFVSAEVIDNLRPNEELPFGQSFRDGLSA